MPTASLPSHEIEVPVAVTMRAAVYTGGSQIAVQEVPVPELQCGEILIRVET